MSGNFRKYRHQTVPAAILVLGIVVVVVLGLVANQRDNDRITLESSITAEQVRIRLEACVDSRVKLVDILASHPWESQQQLMERWGDHAGTLLPLFSGVQALNYIDPDGVIRVVYPLEVNRPALNFALHDHINTSVKEALSQAEASPPVTRTDVVELLQSGKGIAVYERIYAKDGQPLGFANGVFRTEQLIAACLTENNLQTHFVFSLSEAGIPIYQQPSAHAPPRGPYLVSENIDIAGHPWQFDFAPQRSYIDDTNSVVDELWIAVGLLLTCLIAFATRRLLVKQNALEESQDDYRLLVENQLDMVVKVSMSGEFLYVSPSYCRAFGKTEGELLGQQFMPLVHEDDRELTRRSFESLNRPPHSSYHEQRALTRDGWRWLAWTNTAVLNEQGEVEAITGMGRDVSDLKSLEQNMAHAQKMKALGEMAGGITHDFNNLLQVIRGNIEFLLTEHKQDSDLHERLERVCSVVERAMNLTRKLATLSRQQSTRKEMFDLNECSADFLALLKHTFPTSISISLELYKEPLMIFADRTLLEQALLNICFNARDAMASAGELSIKLDKKTVDNDLLPYVPDIAPGDYAVISLHDNGCGMEPEVLQQIFDPFFTTKVVGAGTGLGLANCYSIIKQHDGVILVDSMKGAGSTFSIYIPVSELPVPGLSEDGVVDDKPGKSGANLILVADDNQDILDLTCLILHSAGYKTIVAVDGEQALACFDKHRQEISLILLDLVMPKLGGQAVAESIRLVDANIKIMYISGYIPDNSAASLKEPILMKPYGRDALLQRVAELLAP